MNVQQQRQRLDAQARAAGIDVDRLHKELQEMKNVMDEAEGRVRKRKSFLGRLFWQPFSMWKGLGYIDPELDAEIERIRQNQK